MLKSMLALVTAAVIAGVFVGLVPPPAPASANAALPAVSAAAASQSATPPSPAAAGSVGCTQAWPYYEQACLHDSRNPSNAVRSARVVARNR